MPSSGEELAAEPEHEDEREQNNRDDHGIEPVPRVFRRLYPFFESTTFGFTVAQLRPPPDRSDGCVSALSAAAEFGDKR